MSGSSLDGLDVCLVKFNKSDHWEYEIEAAETLNIPKHIEGQLRNAPALSTLDLLQLDVTYGAWIAQALGSWLSGRSDIDVIGIHGHTVFHEPDHKISLQIGNGNLVCQQLGLPVVDNFRATDCYHGGQGAPLVPVGEALLLPGYVAYLNLGGIANISIHHNGITAWDVAPCNQVLNHFAHALGKPYDAGGELARTGKIAHAWKSQIEALAYFQQAPPKSLANQWTANILELDAPQAEDALRTYVDFLAQEIAKTVSGHTGKLLVTGGGALNSFLVSEIQKACADSIIVETPEQELVEYKEALVFALLGTLKKIGLPNVYASVTGAKKDTVSGTLHLPG